MSGYVLEDGDEAMGINTRMEWLGRRQWFGTASVGIDGIRSDAARSNTVYIDSQVEIAADTVIHPCVTISGAGKIGANCIIESGKYIIDSVLGEGVQVLQGSRLNIGPEVGDNSSIGPMAHIRPETRIGKKARVGNFVEVKKSTIGDGTKASHLTYLGDSTIGKEVN